MDTPQMLESTLAAPVGADEPLGPPVPAPLGTRRDFCIAACQALSLGAIAATLQACGGADNPNEPSGGFNAPALPSLTAAAANGAATLSVDGTVLSSTGGAAMVSSGLGTLLVVRNDATSVSAYSATCTHQQCTINGFTENVFQCPCHGSRFSPTNGSVLRGPATAPLRRFTASITNGVVTITA
jgi:Rieske Fe-S protein